MGARNTQPARMKLSDVAALTAFLVLTVLLAAWYLHAHRAGGDAFCPGPKNINLYDHPYKDYPSYEGRGALWWDGDHHCAAYCQQSPCAVWCR